MSAATNMPTATEIELTLVIQRLQYSKSLRVAIPFGLSILFVIYISTGAMLRPAFAAVPCLQSQCIKALGVQTGKLPQDAEPVGGVESLNSKNWNICRVQKFRASKTGNSGMMALY